MDVEKAQWFHSNHEWMDAHMFDCGEKLQVTRRVPSRAEITPLGYYTCNLQVHSNPSKGTELNMDVGPCGGDLVRL